MRRGSLFQIRFQDKRQSVANRKFFPTSVYLTPPLKGVLLGVWCRRWGQKNWNDGATGPRKKFNDVFSRIDAIHERDGWRWTDGRADGRTPADSKDRAYA